jgi:chromosome segregation ATPase
LREDLDYLRGSVYRNKDVLGHARDENDHLRAEAGKLNGDLSHERHINDDLRRELDAVNANIDAATHALYDKRGRIGALNDTIDLSKHAQDGLGASVSATEDDNRVRLLMNVEANDKIKQLDDQIQHMLHLIDGSKHKLNSEYDATNYLSRDKDNFAVRNSNLNSTIHSLQIGLEDRQREIASLNVSLADLNSLYHSRLASNNHLENDIGHLSYKVNALETHNKGINQDHWHVADRNAYAHGDHGRANFYQHKRRDLEDMLASSKSHVDYVRATSPARSPVRKYR